MRNLSLAVAAFAALSVSARADMFRPSKTQQVELGVRAATELRHKEKVLPTSDARVRLVRKIGSRLLSTYSDKTDPWRFSFDVIESKEVNAFALPGGPTFIFTGLLEKLKTEDELAGIMGHELTHVIKEHWASAYSDQQKRQLGLSLLLIFSRADNKIANIAGVSSELLFDLPFSRKHETAADEGGLKMMTKAGYNPNGMVDVFTMLSKQGGKVPEFLSDHPSDDRRIKHMKEIIGKMPATYPPARPLKLPAKPPATSG